MSILKDCDIKCNNNINNNYENKFIWYDQTDLINLNLGICGNKNNPLFLDNDKFKLIINDISIGKYNNEKISCKINKGINNLTDDNKDKSIYYTIIDNNIENIHISLHISDENNNIRLHISIKNKNTPYDDSIKYRILYNIYEKKYGIIYYDYDINNYYLFYNLNYNYTIHIENFINILLKVGILYKLNEYENSSEIKKQLNVNSSNFKINENSSEIKKKQLNVNSSNFINNELNENSSKFKKQLNIKSDNFKINGGFYYKYIKYYNKYKDLKNNNILK